MTYFADLSPYTYRSGSDVVSLRPGPPPFRVIQSAAPRINVGWLGRFHRRRTGTVPEGTLGALLDVISSQMVNITRGIHGCHMCSASTRRLDWNGRTVLMGNGEIRIPAVDGSLFAAPTLIGHYVAAHRYLPPAAFVHALNDYCRTTPDDLALGWTLTPPPVSRQPTSHA